MDDGELLVANRLLIDSRPGVSVGDDAPPLSATLLDGKSITLEAYKGRYVLLDFWATWCGPCIAEFPNLRELHDACADNPRFAMVSLSVDTGIDAPKEFIAQHPLPWTQAHVGDPRTGPVGRAYQIDSVPATFLIGPDGKILAKDLRGKELRAAVLNALKDRAIDSSETRGAD